jgi:hypothetical protein
MAELKQLGCILSPWDNRNLAYAIRPPTLAEAEAIPEEYDGLAKYCYCTGNQGSVGSCTGWGAKAVKNAIVRLNDKKEIEFSAGSIYYHGRLLCEPQLPEETDGAYCIAIMKCLSKIGATPELFSPTDTSSPFRVNDQTGWESEAAKYKIATYHSVQTDEASLKAALYGVTFEQPYKMEDGSSGKCPLYVAIPVYDSVYNLKQGRASIPKQGDKLYGYHAVAIRGWKIIEGIPYWVMINSWGTSYGDNGICYLPIGYPISEAWMVTDDPASDSPEPVPPIKKNIFIVFIDIILSLIKNMFRKK